AGKPRAELVERFDEQKKTGRSSARFFIQFFLPQNPSKTFHQNKSLNSDKIWCTSSVGDLLQIARH
ncbi:hypothetical protein, partial [Klebsiella michiganensis]|uniref:hypothetical protein n=1 Tax=Klebsiella michiganensis TaxID=1134687 RepID=UPI000665B23B